ncbi:MAG: ABC transporter permease, partial [Clostridium sp.]
NLKDSSIDIINNDQSVEETQYVMSTGVLVSNGSKTESSLVNITEDNVSLKLLSTYGDATNYLPLEGIIIEDKLAEEFNLSSGDFIDIKLSGKEDFINVQISEISKDVKGIYLSKTYLNEVGEKFLPNSVYVKTNNVDSFKENIESYDFIKHYEMKDTITDAIVNKISVLSLVVYMLILLGGILALVVLYNLGIMSFYEQIRSLATLMVLGFYTKEIKKLQLTENIIFTVIGIATGIPLGIGLTKVITGSLTLANLQPSTTLMSYTISGALTIVFAIMVNVIIGKMFKNIDMLGALKSVE